MKKAGKGKDKVLGIITIFLKELQQLKSGALQGKPSPYVKIIAGQPPSKEKAVFQTDVKQGDDNPVFNQKFTFELNDYEVEDEIIFLVKGWSRFGRPSNLGKHVLRIEDIIDGGNKNIVKDEDLMEQDGRIRYEIKYTNLSDQDQTGDSNDQAKHFKYRGALKIHFLSVQNCLQKFRDIKKGYIKIIYGPENDQQIYKTTEFTKDSSQLNYSVIIPFKVDPIRQKHIKDLKDQFGITSFIFQLINPTESSSSNQQAVQQTVGESIINFEGKEKIKLYVNKPKNHKIQFTEENQENNQKTNSNRSAYVEFKYLRNHFVQNIELKPGMIELVINRITYQKMDSAVFIFDSGDKSDAFGSQGTKKYLNVKSMVHTISIKMYGKQNISSFKGDFSSLKTINFDAQELIVLADLNWKQSDSDEIQSFAITRLIFSSNKYQATVDFQLYFRAEEKWTKGIKKKQPIIESSNNIQDQMGMSRQRLPSQRDIKDPKQIQQQKQTIIKSIEQIKEEDDDLAASMQDQQLTLQNENAIDYNIDGIMTIQQMKDIAKKKPKYEDGKRYILNLSQLKILNLELNSLMKNEGLGFSLYMQISVSNEAKTYFTYTVQNTTQWSNLDIPIIIDDPQKDRKCYIEFKLFDQSIIFDQKSEQDGKKNTPYPFNITELVTFQIPIKDLVKDYEEQDVSQKLSLNFEKRAETSVENNTFSSEFKSFYKNLNKEMKINEVMEITKLQFKYRMNQSIFLDYPVGIFSVVYFKGHDISHQNSNKFSPIVVYELGEQIAQHTDYQGGSSKNPQFTNVLDFITFNENATLKVTLYDSSTGNNVPIFNTYLQLKDLNIISTQPFDHIIDLEEIDPSNLQGGIQLQLQYVQIKDERHPYYYFKYQQQLQLKDPVDDKKNWQFWGARHKHHLNKQQKAPKQINVDNHRVNLKLNILGVNVPGLNAGDQIRVSYSIMDQRGLTSYIQGSNQFESKYMFTPPAKFDVCLNPHQEKDNRYITFELQVIQKKHNNWVQNEISTHFNWQQYPIKKFSKNYFEIDFGEDSSKEYKIFFEYQLIEDIFQDTRFGMMHFKLKQQRIMNFFPENAEIMFRSNYLYVLKVKCGNNDDQNYILHGKDLPNYKINNVIFQDFLYLDSVQKIDNIDNVTASERERLVSQNSITFNEMISVMMQDKQDIMTFELYQVADSQIKNDFSQLDKRLFHLTNTADVIYRGHIKIFELLQYLQKPNEEFSYALKMYRQNPPVLIRNDEHMKNKLSQYQEESYLIFTFNFEQLNDIKNDNDLYDLPYNLIKNIDMQSKTNPLQEVTNGIYEIQLQQMQQVMQLNNLQVYGNVLDFRKVNKMVIGGVNANSFQAPRTDVNDQYRNFYERSIRCHNTNLSQFQQQLLKVFTPQTISHFFITLTQLYIEQFAISSLKSKSNALFRDVVTEQDINLYDLEYKPRQKLQLQHAMKSSNIKTQTIDFNLRLNDTNFTQNYEQQITVCKIQVFGLEKKDEIPNLYLNFRICHDKLDYVNESPYMPFYQGNMAELQQADQQIQHCSSDNHSRETVFFENFKENSMLNCFENDECDILLATRNPTDILHIYLRDSQNKFQQQISRYSYPLYNYDEELGGEKCIEFTLFANFKEKYSKQMRIRAYFKVIDGQVQSENKTSLSMKQVIRIRQQINRVRERLHKVYYYDSEMNGYQFDAPFRKKFKNIGSNYVKQEFAMMKKLKVLNQDGFKKYLPDQPDYQIIHFSLPRGTIIGFKSSFNIKFPLNIIMTLKNQQLWDEDIVITNELRGDAFDYKEKRDDDGDTIEQTDISFNEDLDFYLNQKRLEEAEEIQLIFKYMNKEKQICEEQGEISKKNLVDLFQIDKDDMEQRDKFFENNYILVLIRPSNLKLFLAARKMINNFIENPVGKLKVNFHRLIKVKDDEMRAAKGFTDIWDDVGSDYWNDQKVYRKGERVIYGIHTYKCTGEHKARDPKKNYIFWNFIGEKQEDENDKSEIEEWSKIKIYKQGDVVHYVGLCYKCTGNNVNIQPQEDEEQNISWENISYGEQIKGYWDKNKSYMIGDKVIHKSHLFKANRDNTNIEPKILIRYVNKNLFAKEGTEGSSFSQCYAMLKVKVNGQKDYTQLLDNSGNGIGDASTFQQFEYYTSHYDDKLDFKLLISGILDQKSLMSQGEKSLVKRDPSEEKDDSYLKRNKQINLCKGKLQIADLVYHRYNPVSHYYFLCPLTVMNYHKSEDIIGSFYRNLDREDIYVLGSIQYKEQEWVNIIMDVMSIQKVLFDLQHSVFQPVEVVDGDDEEDQQEFEQDQLEDSGSQLSVQVVDSKQELQQEKEKQYYLDESKIVYIGLRIKTSSTHSNKDDQEMEQHECQLQSLSIGEIIEKQKDSKFQGFQFDFDPTEKMNNIYIQDPNITNIIATFEIFCRVDRDEKVISSKLFPLKKFSEPKYLNRETEVFIEIKNQDFNQRKEKLIIVDEDRHPQAHCVLQGIRDIKPKNKFNVFEAKIQKKKEEQDKLQEQQQVDFRKTKLSKMLETLINTDSKMLFQKVMKELHELFIYVDYKHYKKDYEICIKILLYCLRIYYHETTILADILQNLFSLVVVDIKKSRKILEKHNIFLILSELASDMIDTQEPSQEDIEKVQNIISQNKDKAQKIDVINQEFKDQEFVPNVNADQIENQSIDIEQIKAKMLYQRHKYLSQMKLSTQQSEQLQDSGNNKLKKAKSMKKQKTLKTQKTLKGGQQQQSEELMQKEAEEQARAAQYINKILECYINKDLSKSIEAIQFMQVFNQLTFYFFDDSKTISQVFSMIVSNYILMTGYSEGEENIKDTFFRDMLLTLCRGKGNFKNPQVEIPQNVKCATSLFSYICFQSDMSRKRHEEQEVKFDYEKGSEVIYSCINQYLDFLFYSLEEMKNKRDIQFNILRSMFEDFTVFINYPNVQNVIKDFWQEHNINQQFQSLLRDEFIYVAGKKEEQAGLFNEEAVIEGIFKVLKILSGDYRFEDKMFDKLIKYLKERVKTIKRIKRKNIVDEYLQFMSMKDYLMNKKQNENKIKDKKKKILGDDPITRQKKLATKYLISNYDWMNK